MVSHRSKRKRRDDAALRQRPQVPDRIDVCLVATRFGPPDAGPVEERVAHDQQRSPSPPRSVNRVWCGGVGPGSAGHRLGWDAVLRSPRKATSRAAFACAAMTSHIAASAPRPRQTAGLGDQATPAPAGPGRRCGPGAPDVRGRCDRHLRRRRQQSTRLADDSGGGSRRQPRRGGVGRPNDGPARNGNRKRGHPRLRRRRELQRQPVTVAPGRSGCTHQAHAAHGSSGPT